VVGSIWRIEVYADAAGAKKTENSSTVEGPLQQQLPATDLTRRAACPNFSRTISFTF